MTIAAYGAELLAAILATIYFYKYRDTSYWLFMPYLWYVILNEIAAYILLNEGLIKYELSNIFVTLTVPLFSYFVITNVDAKGLKKTMTFATLLFIGLTVVEAITKGFSEAWSIQEIATSVIGILGFSIYVIHLFRSSQTSNPFTSLFTYIILGFVLSFVSAPVINTARVLYLDNPTLSYQLTYLMAGIVILMYCIFAFGMLRSKKQSA